MQLKEIMTRDVETVGPTDTLQHAAQIMQKSDIGAVPVCDGNTLSGMITDRDIAIRAVAEGKDPFVTSVQDVMTNKLVFATEDQDVEEAAHLMEQEQIRRLPILDKNRRLVGIVALGDLARETTPSLSGEALEGISQPEA